MFDVVFGVAYCVIFVADYVQLASQHQPVQLHWGRRADWYCVQQRILHTQEYISFYILYIIYIYFLLHPQGQRLVPHLRLQQVQEHRQRQ